MDLGETVGKILIFCNVPQHSPPPLAATQMGIGAAATPREGTLGGGSALTLPLYIEEAKGQPNTRSSSPVGAALPLFLHLPRGAW